MVYCDNKRPFSLHLLLFTQTLRRPFVSIFQNKLKLLLHTFASLSLPNLLETTDVYSFRINNFRFWTAFPRILRPLISLL